MANDIDLVTLAQAKDAISAIGKAGTLTSTAIPILEDIITRASDWFNRQTGRVLARTVYSNMLVKGDGRKIMVLEWPIVPGEALSISVDGTTQTVWLPTNSADDPINFDVEINEYRLQGWKDFYRRSGWPLPPVQIRASFTAGYALTVDDSDNPLDIEVPARLREGVLALVRDAWRLTDRQMSGIASMSAGSQTVTFDSLDIPKRVLEIADSFSRAEMLVLF